MTHFLSDVPGSTAVRRMRIVVCVGLFSLMAPFSAESADLDGDILETAQNATVFLRVDRLFAGREVSTTGTGFFIDANGWILTNEHVVAETMLVPVGGEIQKARSTILGVAVVVRSGTQTEVEVDAEVVARDASADLALLKVKKTHNAMLDVWREVEPAVTDEVWVVGYPFGELLAIERWQISEIANPVVSVNQGRISALRRGTEGDLRMIQTDAAVNPGNSGGPMISGDGAVLGVVTARVGSGGVGFAISLERIQEFVLNKGYKVRFQPPVIADATEDLIVRLESGLIDLGSMNGTFSIGGGQTPETSTPLRWNGHSLEARVALAPSSSLDASEGLLRGTIEIKPTDRPPVARVFRIRGTSSMTRAAQTASVGGTGYSKPAASEIDTSSGPKPLGLGGGKKFSGARSSSGSGGGGVKISDQLMAEIHELKFSEERYAELTEYDERSLAEQYDRAGYDAYRLLVKIDQLDWRNNKERDRLREEIDAKLDELSNLQKELRTADICRCGVKWRLCDDQKCNDPEKPWIEDDLGEIRKALR